uniref:Terpene synthase n=1 Tax=Laurencia subopposita TaxID=3071698 RepID=A0AA96UZU7_9FLOR|nr:TS-2 [Laurencia subopposita]
MPGNNFPSSLSSEEQNCGFAKVKYSSFNLLGTDFVNEHEQEAYEKSLALLQSLRIINTAKQLEAVKKSQFERITARTFPFANMERLTVANDMMILTFLIDDHWDSVDAEDKKAMDRVNMVSSQLVNILQGHEPQPNDDPVIFGMKSILDRTISMNSNWIRLMREDYIRGLEVCHLERVSRMDADTLTLPMYESNRYYSAIALPFIDLSAAMVCSGDPNDVLSSPYIQMMTRLAVYHISYSNDIIGFHKERKETSLNNLIKVMAKNNQQSFEDALEGALKSTNQLVDAFLNLEKMVHIHGLSLHVGRDRLNGDILKYIEVLKYWMRGSLDWHFESARYKDYTPISS